MVESDGRCDKGWGALSRVREAGARPPEARQGDELLRKIAQERVRRPPKAVGVHPRLLPPVETLPVGALGQLLHQADSRLRILADAERSRRANLRRGLAKFDRITAAWTLRHSSALAKSKTVLAAFPVSDSVKTRISRLLDRAPIGRFRDRPEGPKAAQFLREILRAPSACAELLELLRQVEESKRLPPGTTDDLSEARALADGFFRSVARFAIELGLEQLDTEIRGYQGRPSAGRWAKLATAIAAEIKRESPRRVWPMVVDLLRPLIEASGDKILTDANNIRQLVVSFNRRQRRRGRGDSQAASALVNILQSTEWRRAKED
jgi:hypothetical protein